MRQTRHNYSVTVRWTGNKGEGTASYRAYHRSYDIDAAGKPTILGSSDPNFLGDAARWNPEELLLASISSCHKLWYLHFCAEAGVVVEGYEDRAEAEMIENSDGSGEFSRAILRPNVIISAQSNPEIAQSLHEKAHSFCFIARSVNFPVEHVATVSTTTRI